MRFNDAGVGVGVRLFEFRFELVVPFTEGAVSSFLVCADGCAGAG